MYMIVYRFSFVNTKITNNHNIVEKINIKYILTNRYIVYYAVDKKRIIIHENIQY